MYTTSPSARTSIPPSRDFGRIVARVFCAVFALIGVLPLSAGLITRSEVATSWAAAQARHLLHTQLGLAARFDLEISLLPLQVELRDLAVEASDGGSPVLSAPRLSVAPRLFSLLGGRFDAGHISLESPEVRVVLREGKLTNLSLPSTPSSGGDGKPPFSSLAITSARLQASIDGAQVRAEGVDLDVYSDGGENLEIAARTGFARLSVRRPLPTGSEPPEALDEDVLCQLDARLRISPGQVLVRRLSLLGAVDTDPGPGTARQCSRELLTQDPNRVLMRVSTLAARHLDGNLRHASGHVLLRAPLSVANRYLGGAHMTGWVGLSGELDFSGDESLLPDFHGKLKTGALTYDEVHVVRSFEGELHLLGGQVLMPSAVATYGDGRVDLEGVQLSLLAPGLPLAVASAHIQGLGFPSLIRDLDITPNTIVRWDLDSVKIESFRGPLSPLHIEGRLTGETGPMKIFDRAWHDPARQTMLGIERSRLQGIFGVHGDSIHFDRMSARFGSSQAHVSVRLGYDGSIGITMPEEASVELSDLGPIAGIPWSGRASLKMQMSGPGSNPVLTGALGIEDFVFSGFPLGRLTSSSVRFVPLRLDFANAELRAGMSQTYLRDATLDFDAPDGSVLSAEAKIDSPRLMLDDFFHMWNLDDDPRWDGIAGRADVSALLKYELGGPKDRCGLGNLRILGSAQLPRAIIYEERYSSGRADFDFEWFDIEAGALGMRLTVPDFAVHKGAGTVVGSLRLRDGGQIRSQLLASNIPVARVQAFSMFPGVVGTIDAQADVLGTLDEMGARAQVRTSVLRVGRAELPTSALSVTLTPTTPEEPAAPLDRTACGSPRSPPFDPADFAKDRPSGVFHLSGQLFGGQLRFDELEVTRQRAKHVRGKLAFESFDLHALANLMPALAQLEPQPRGSLSGDVLIRSAPLESLFEGEGSLTIRHLSANQGSTKLGWSPGSRLSLKNGRLAINPTTVQVTTATGQAGRLSVRGSLSSINETPRADLALDLEPVSLDALRPLMTNAERASGSIEGALRVKGPLDAPNYTGGIRLRDGAVHFRGTTPALSNINLRVGIAPGELVLEDGRFEIGGGKVKVSGTAPLRGISIGEVQTYITAKQVRLPLPTGISAVVDAELRGTYEPFANGVEGRRRLPHLVGTVDLTSMSYNRPVTLAAGIKDLAQRGNRTEFDAYQPEADAFSFDVAVRADQPLRLDNNLIEASLTIENEALQLAGTNQRFGMRGALALVPGGLVHLRQNEFEIQQGRVRFEDPSRIAPLVDVTAVTEYRRYGAASEQVASVAGSNNNVGQWRITMRAHGDAENIQVDLSSQPTLSQDDILLLLTVGLTRQELDQGQNSALSETVALEALTALTGADKVLTEAIPVIDEFRVGTAYSSRTGQSEPTITIGKQLSKRIRAFVTTSVAESRDVRSNVQVKINRKVSIEGSYDNVNNLSTASSLGNLGADVRWRLDFE